MKLLFDENLSFRLCHLLKDVFPGSDTLSARVCPEQKIPRYGIMHGSAG